MFQFPARSVNLFVKDEVLASGYGVRRDDILAGSRVDGVITVRIDLQVIEDELQFAERNVDTNDSHDTVIGIADGIGTGDDDSMRALVVRVRVRPIGMVFRQTVVEPLRLRVVVAGTAYLTDGKTLLGPFVAGAIDLVPVSLLRVIIRHESYSGSLYVLQGLEQHVYASRHGVRVVQTELRHLGKHLRSGFELHGGGVDLLFRRPQLGLCTIDGIRFDSGTRVEILYAGNRLHRQYGNEHQPQPCMGP